MTGLMAFMVKGHIILFNRIDDKKAATVVAARPASKVDWTSQESLQCLITLELMIDPVMVAMVHSYNRTSIKKWRKSGCWAFPITDECLCRVELVPNLVIHVY
jgi:hypothetical protein